MTDDQQAFISGIEDDPDNDLRRLIYADWLDEHGHTEASEYLRLVDQLSHTELDAPERVELANSLMEISAGLDREWRESVGKRFDLILEGWLAKAARSVFHLLRWFSITGEPFAKAKDETDPPRLTLRSHLLLEDAETLLRRVYHDRSVPHQVPSLMLRLIPSSQRLNLPGRAEPPSE